MAERITAISMQAFRGVPGEFTLDLPGGRSGVVLGDNGTGKSSIADAVEWYFTGQIELLTKEDRGDAIRHTGASEELSPKVTISTDGSLGGAITTAASSRPGVRDIGRGESFLLRHRTLAEFVDKTKGEKWQALSELLGLDAIDKMRLDLQRARNELDRLSQSARGDLDQKRETLSSQFQEVSEGAILDAIRGKCGAADIEPPQSLEQALSEGWVQTIVPASSYEARAAALGASLTQLRVTSEALPSADPLLPWNDFVDRGAQDQRPLRLYQAAESLLNSDYEHAGHCPLCGQPIELDELTARVSSELGELRDAAQALDEARRGARSFVGSLRDARATRTEIARAAEGHGVRLANVPARPDVELSHQVDSILEMEQGAVDTFLKDLACWDADALVTLESEIPEPASQREQLLVELGVLVRDARAWRLALLRHEDASAAVDLADRVFTSYQSRQLRYFDQTVKEISTRVAQIYQFLHPEGGIGEVAIETVGEKGAELAVEFHGRHERPPHRVLSESHLNSLGISLFLAMAETFNGQLGFLVLDDVVNSFDREHRGRLSELLVNEFEETQLIVLTHDELFFTQLTRQAPSWVKVEFTSWSYETGPRTQASNSARVLAEARESLEGGKRISAAQQGRRALEEFLQEACEHLESLLPFRRGRRNDQRTAEEVMKGLRRTLRTRARPLYDQTKQLLNELEADLQASLNVESHANQAGSSGQEVKDALERISGLQRSFTCEVCETRVWHRGSAEASQCQCGQSQFPPAKAPAEGAPR